MQFQPGNAVRLQGRFDRHLCGFQQKYLSKSPSEVAKSSTGTTFGNWCGTASNGAIAVKACAILNLDMFAFILDATLYFIYLPKYCALFFVQ